MAAGENRGHAGNVGYDDQFDAYYSWDSKVQNHKNLRVGDAIALWDKERLLGVSVIEEIEADLGMKELRRCPDCSTTRIQHRANGSWRCSKCTHVFAEPVREPIEVIRYRARYDAAWTSLDGLLSAAELRPLTEKPKSFNAIRELDWARFSQALVEREAALAVARIGTRSPEISWTHGVDLRVSIPQGHRQALVRVRRGQRAFRDHLLASQGSSCAFTGSAPARVLEAGHLYSYARLGEHHQHGGLMLRRDIHRLFDDGALAVEPNRLRVDVSPELETYPQYARLHDGRLALDLRDEQIEWLTAHWEEHRVAVRHAAAR